MNRSMDVLFGNRLGYVTPVEAASPPLKRYRYKAGKAVGEAMFHF